jgi:hypothetical protein
MKILYFEGAGCVPRGEVENCRIRTAFTNKEGRQIYLELSGSENAYELKPKIKQIKGSFGWIDHCEYIDEGDYDGGVKKIQGLKASPNVNYQYNYTKAEILRIVNDILGGDFDAIMVLPDLSGYRVHKGKGKCNFGDEFVYDEKRTKQAERIQWYYYDKEKERGVKFPCFSIWFEDDVLNVRFYDGRGTTKIHDVYGFNFA